MEHHGTVPHRRRRCGPQPTPADRRRADDLTVGRLAPVVTGLLLALLGSAWGAGVADAQPGLRAQPLVDRAPVVTGFADRVITGRSAGTRATRRALRAGVSRSDIHAYPTRAGAAVTVEYADGYVVDPSVGQSYADFLAGLPHGSELGRLTVRITPPADINADCGGSAGDEILACYDDGTETMTVPGEEISDGTGVTTSYVIAHEYGHHIARNRSNPPFGAPSYGPKRWASYELVCARTQSGQLFPGDEGDNYIRNPGENWAETYARLTYPSQAWTFSSLLRPDAGATSAARADVTSPWTSRRSTTFTGRLSSRTTRRAHRFTLRLDGALSIKLHGPSRANFNLDVRSSGGTHDTTSAKGSSDGLSYQAACRATRSERVTVTVVRRSGSGPYSIKVRYAG